MKVEMTPALRLVNTHHTDLTALGMTGWEVTAPDTLEVIVENAEQATLLARLLADDLDGVRLLVRDAHGTYHTAPMDDAIHGPEAVEHAARALHGIDGWHAPRTAHPVLLAATLDRAEELQVLLRPAWQGGVDVATEWLREY